jgi:pyruvate dehydrogenase E1 component alpha subunit
MTAGAGPAARARAIGVSAVEVDGNDVLAVDAAAAELIGAIRAGDGPRFLHARTYRITGHTGADPATYRPAGEVEAQASNDPIGRARDTLLAAGISAAEVDAVPSAALAEMEAAYDSARAAPYPPAAQAFVDVQDIGSPAVEAF